MSVQSLGRLWLATGIALTTATQLRVPGSPLGPGELLLAAWIGAVALGVLLRGATDRTALGAAVGTLWLAFLTLMCGGWVVAYLRGRQDPMALHDFPAFLFAACFVAALCFRRDGEAELRRTAPTLSAVVVAPLLAMLLLLPVTPTVGPIVTWVGRFQGWAINANAVAFAVAPVPFVMLHLLRGPLSRGARVRYRLLLAGAVAVGIASFSDALFVAWAAASALLVVDWLWRTITRRRHAFGAAATAQLLLPLFGFVLAAFVALRFTGTFVAVVADMYGGQNNQGGVRLALWKHGLEAVASSPLVGLGPGPHSGLTAPFQGNEAHNSFIDWSASAGVPGVLLFVGLLAWIGIRTLKSRSAPLTAALGTLVLMSVFHYVLRHPTFWFWALWLLAEARAAFTARAPLVRQPRATPAPAT